VVGTAATAAVFAGTAGAVQHHQQKKWAQQDQQAAYEAQQAQQVQQAPQAAYEPEPEYYEQPPEEDVITQLERLGALKAQGILTEEEFAAQKAKLLGM